MALDAYGPCPCGSGEKYKFCCPKELHAEFERVLEMLQADQRAAALDACDRVLAKHANQACFLTLKAQFLVQLGEFAGLQATANRLLMAAPSHPAGHAAACLIAASEGNMITAIDHLQDAVERSKNCIGDLLSWAMESVIFSCYSNDAVLPAIAFALAHMRQRHPSQINERVAQILRELLGDLTVPIVLREDWQRRLTGIPSVAANVNLREFFEMAKFRELRGKAVELRAKSPDDPGACLMLGLSHAFLGRNAEAITQFEELARMASATEILATDGFLLAYYLQDEHEPIGEPLLLRAFPVHDAEKLLEYLASHRQLVASTGDLRQYAAEDGPPPKARFELFDRPIPVNPQDCPPLELPIALGSLSLFGRQTDRGAELVVIAVEDTGGKTAQFMAEIPEGLLGPASVSEISGYLGPLNQGLIPRRYAGRQLSRPPTEVSGVIFQDAFAVRWFDLPHPFLHGKRPEEASNIPELRIPLIAALLMLETSASAMAWDGDFSSHWSRLGLKRELADRPEEYPGAETVGMISLVRIDPSRCSDEALLRYAERAALGMANPALGRFAAEVMRRRGGFPTQSVVAFIENCALNISHPRLRLEFLQQVVAFSRETGAMEPGVWEIAEFEALLVMGDGERAGAKLKAIMTSYRHNEQIMQALGETMMALGIIDREGRPIGVLPTAPNDGDQGERAASTIWTPDQRATDAPPGNAPSKLWLPGS